ncbi:MAG: polysaccharide deacetylase family protein, partial [Thermomicrobiales bacterium]
MSTPITRILQILLIPVLLLSSTTLVSAQSTTLTVAGTTGVNIRSCPEIDCDVLAVADLGSVVTSTGDDVDGFTPVEVNGVAGFAFSLYLVEEGEDLWFTEGEAGCDRIALIFDIGIGFEPSQSILDTLVETDTTATMFPMGIFADDQPEFLLEMHELGFPIGTHGNDPLFLTEQEADIIADDVSKSLD